jgi:D-glycerate 3-kinase
MPEIVDDKSQHCIPFLLSRLQAHAERHGTSADADAADQTPPFFLGLNGVQGAGKTVLVSSRYCVLGPNEPRELSLCRCSA